MNKYIAIDQYGRSFYIEKYPYTELKKAFPGRIYKMYVDTKGGGTKPVGYVVGQHWFRVHELADWKP
jgi:hypothetical protein